MNEPEDFGLDPVACIAHVYDGRRSSLHAPFWRAWDHAVFSHHPALIERRTDDAGDPTGTHEFESHKHVPIGCRLVEPSPGTPLLGGLLVVHGYEGVGTLAEDGARWAPAGERGLLTLILRVRGFPGSIAATGDLTAIPGGYVSYGLDVPVERPADGCAWVVSDAAADVVNGARVLRDELLRRTGRHLPLFIQGESFGAALAIIAAARLQDGDCEMDDVRRLVVGTPSLGAWSWRITHPSPFGAGGEILAVIRDLRDRGEKLYRTLRLFDSAVHARCVRVPAFGKLAMRDEVVPAPTAAAVFNALRSPTGMKRRFLVRYGHFEGGIANARRHAEFARAAEVFLDPSIDDATAIARVDALAPSSGQVTGRSAMETSETALIDAYVRAGRTLDDLPYTSQFESIFGALGGDGAVRSRRDILHKLLNLRKAGRLPRLGPAPGKPTQISPDDELHLRSLVDHYAGSLGHRDRLAYTPEFDTLTERFNDETGHNLSPHDVWRLVARLAK